MLTTFAEMFFLLYKVFNVYRVAYLAYSVVSSAILQSSMQFPRWQEYEAMF